MGAQQGFTLIEVAVALIVLAVGLLGIAGMQSSGMQNTLKSHHRAVAMMQAQDIADRIRANIAGMRGKEYVKAIPNPAPSPDCMTSSNTCTPVQLAATDLYNWDTANKAALPSAQSQITCTDIDATTTTIYEAGTSCTITIRWDGDRSGATGTGCSGSGSDLTCLRMRITP
jgi:type IV pilus assembly protein PilV